MSGLDGTRLRRFLKLAGERLRGDWVVIGGCVLPLLGVEHRVTVDIEIAGPDDSGMKDTLILFGIAEELGLPVETINQAGALFLRRIPFWESNLIEIHRGSGATLHVPDATLFLLLKIRRLTESDLGDCLAMLDLARGQGDPPNGKRLNEAVQAELASDVPPERKRRLLLLAQALTHNSGGPPE